MDMKDFKLSIYESDLSNADKEYMIAITEMAGGAAFGLVVAGALSGCIAAAAIQVRQIKTAARLYEKLYPDIPKWGSLKTEDNPIGLMSFQKTIPKKLKGKNASATVTSVSQEKRKFIGSTEDGTKLFEILYHIDEKDTTSYKVTYESKNDIGYQHSGYYTACFCYSHNIIFPAMHKWAKTVRGQVKQSKKKEKSVNESGILATAAAVAPQSLAISSIMLGVTLADRRRILRTATEKYYNALSTKIPKLSSMKKESNNEGKKWDVKYFLGKTEFLHVTGTYSKLTSGSTKHLNYKTNTSIASKHKDYYWACFCYENGIFFDNDILKWAKNIIRGKIDITESVNSLFSTDNTINAGLMAGIAGQAGVSAFSNQERSLRSELGQIQTALQYNAGNLTSQQQNMLLSRSGIIMEELARAERRKGTAVAIRNAALMIAAAAKIKKMIAQDRLYGPDNPDMLRLIGGLPEIN